MTLRELQDFFGSCHWFSHVGVPYNDKFVGVMSWEEADLSASSEQFATAKMESINGLRLKGMSEICNNELPKWREFTKKWKECSASAKQSSEEFFMSSVPGDLFGHPLAFKTFKEAVWISLLAEQLFGDLSHLHREMLYIFRDGHFPCGYVGDIPLGKIVVF